MITYLVGAGAVAVAAGAAYQSLAPEAQWFGRSFTGLKPGSKKLALTYDDGPNPRHTIDLLEVLAKYQVHATFFMIGRYVDERPEIAREVAGAGHVIGNHTFSHPNLIFESARQTRTELSECRRALLDAVGEHAPIFRPPFGARRPASLRIGRSLGLEPILWNVSGFDWRTRSVDYVESKVAQQISGGNVILLHDGGHRLLGEDRGHTIEATDRLIRRYQNQGFQFVTIPQMMAEGTKLAGRTKPAERDLS